MMRKVLVTGASGYIGSVVVDSLLRRGYSVTVFDNLERGHRSNIDQLRALAGNQADNLCGRFDFMEGDLRDEQQIFSAMRKTCPDAVMHFAAYALVGESMADPMKYFTNNIKGGINLLDAMQDIGCRRLIFSSSCATYGVPSCLPIEEDMQQDPTNPYGYSKLAFERMCLWLEQTKDFRPTFLRYFNAAGAVPELGFGEEHEPETHIIPNVLKVALGVRDCVQIFGDDYPTQDGTCVRDYIHLKDLASAHLLALEKGVAGAFNLGTGVGVSVKQIVEACRAVTGLEIPVEICPRRPGDPPALYASGAKARKVLGWQPRFSDIGTIVRDAWDFHRSHFRQIVGAK